MNSKLLPFFLVFIFLQAETMILVEEADIHFRQKKWKVPSFYLDKYEVTQGEYQKFVKEANIRQSLFYQDPRFFEPDQPVTGVDWYDASFYCKAQGKRLPTYIELVRASQGTTPTPYPWGAEFPAMEKAPFVTQGYKPLKPFKVNEFEKFATAEGIFHLSGNVSEWTQDWEQNRVITYGGSFLDDLHHVKTGSYRLVLPSENTLFDLGFRCARSAEDSSNTFAIIERDTEKLKNLVYGKTATQQEMIGEKTKDKLNRIQKMQEEEDEEKRKAWIREKSLEEMNKRESYLSESFESGIEGYVGVPAGWFFFGNDKTKGALKKQLAYTDSFILKKKPVSELDWARFLKSTNYNPVVRKTLTADPQTPALATLKDAVAFCQHQGMDLPTEAMWEKAARGVSEAEKISKNDAYITIGYFNVEEMSDFSEWTKDSWQLENETSENPLNLTGWLITVKGKPPFAEPTGLISQRRPSMPVSLHAFRCAKSSENQPWFQITKEENWFLPEFLHAKRKEIAEDLNPFQISPQAVFENISVDSITPLTGTGSMLQKQ